MKALVWIMRLNWSIRVWFKFYVKGWNGEFVYRLVGIQFVWINNHVVLKPKQKSIWSCQWRIDGSLMTWGFIFSTYNWNEFWVKGSIFFSILKLCWALVKIEKLCVNPVGSRLNVLYCRLEQRWKSQNVNLNSEGGLQIYTEISMRIKGSMEE